MADEKQAANSELKDMMCQLLRTQSAVMNKLDVLSKEVTHLTHRMSQVEKSVESIEHVRQSLAVSMSYVNSFNVMFYGAYLKPGLTLDASFREFMIEFLHANPEKVEDMAFHVQYLPMMSKEDVHPPLCVTFRTDKDRDYIVYKATKYKDSLRQHRICAGGRTHTQTYTWKS